ncbi:hypothetical protein [Streptomyces radicis]|uniref:ABM domain-containing protein n=1 Tax=Streptomyces radicis TaxID=1750517 RepID=A0A3A9WK24_9ACTN|nr:hypothetical protein [Streptomyces radicis]RKN08086.1 hypothetical protein D7319_16310 [Streptomyces radicis]RKN20441.1 hypothetical protein D7318_18170 [Streptomyces radicis]
MATVALMWEARAAQGRGAELLAWARARELSPVPARREAFTAPGERVLVITWWENAALSADLPELPPPPDELLARPVHRWRFERVDDRPRAA